jgi:hypothetical protein
MMASMPPIEGISDSSSPASVTAPPRLPIDVQIGVMETVVGPSRGTRVRGLGSGVAKQPRTRGPARAEPRTAEVEEELARLRANQKELEERLQRQELEREREHQEREREYQERERQEREREREEREREKLEWEARMAQLAEMAKQLSARAPPSDGSNAP